MEIPKHQVVQMLRDKGQDDVADDAAQRLPDQVDPDQHAELLKDHGLDPSELTGRIGL
jgi:hypothetical protein